MEFVRRRRKIILIVFSLFALVAMTFGFLKRIGIDPLGAREPSEQSPPEEPGHPVPGQQSSRR